MNIYSAQCQTVVEFDQMGTKFGTNQRSFILNITS